MSTSMQKILLFGTFAALLAASTEAANAQQLAFPAAFDSPGVLQEGLDKFRGTEEGRSEEEELAEGGVEIVIETYESDEDYGDATVTGEDADGNVTQVTIRVDTSGPGDSDEVADTIKHELRHAQIFIANGAGEEAAHDGLHDGTDAALNEFNSQLAGG